MIKNKIVYYKIKIIVINVFLVALCMYISNPFFLHIFGQLMKYLYYGFCMLPIVHFAMYKRDRNIKLQTVVFVGYFIVYYVLVVLIAQHGDNTYVIYLTRKLFRMSGMIEMVIIWRILFQKYEKILDFGMVYVWSILLYMSTTIFFIINPTAKSAYINLIDIYMSDYIVGMNRYATRFGIAGWSSFGFSIWAVIGLIYLYYMYITQAINIRKMILFMIFVMIGSALYARSGIVLSGVIVMMISLAEVLKKKFRVFYYFLIGASIIIASIVIIQLRFPETKESLSWMFEMVSTKNGVMKSGSTDELFMMYKSFRPTPDTLFFGDAKWNMNDGTYYGNVDVGILRNILYGGIAYTIFEYGIAAYFLHLLNKNINLESNIYKRIFLLMCIFVFVFCELKGDMLFSNIEYMLPILLTSTVYIKKNYNKRNNSEVRL